jgi:hypothetical protein
LPSILRFDRPGRRLAPWKALPILARAIRSALRNTPRIDLVLPNPHSPAIRFRLCWFFQSPAGH